MAYIEYSTVERSKSPNSGYGFWQSLLYCYYLLGMKLKFRLWIEILQ